MKNELFRTVRRHPALALAAGVLVVDGLLFGGQAAAGQNPCESSSNRAIGWMTAPQCQIASEVSSFIADPASVMPEKIAGLPWEAPAEPTANPFDDGMRRIQQPIS